MYNIYIKNYINKYNKEKVKKVYELNSLLYIIII